MTLPHPLRVRTDFTADDLNAVIRLHIEVYCEGLGYDNTFHEHVDPQLRAWAFTAFGFPPARVTQTSSSTLAGA